MPLIKSTTKQAFGENVAAERRAGKPIKQAVAIAYSTKRDSAKDSEHHSSHSARRSAEYHSKNVEPTQVRHSETMATMAKGRKQNLEDVEEKGHKL
jgi:hypothetical protein